MRSTYVISRNALTFALRTHARLLACCLILVTVPLLGRKLVGPKFASRRDHFNLQTKYKEQAIIFILGLKLWSSTMTSYSLYFKCFLDFGVLTLLRLKLDKDNEMPIVEGDMEMLVIVCAFWRVGKPVHFTVFWKHPPYKMVPFERVVTST